MDVPSQDRLEAVWLDCVADLGVEATAVAVRRVERDADEALLASLPTGDPLFQQRKIQDPVRRKDWAEGRRCLLDVRAQLLEGSAGGEIRMSLAHSQGIAIAVGLRLAEGDAPVLAVGVDIEASKREITPKVIQRVASTAEMKHARVEPIELWVIKEACYKANPASQDTVLSHYEIRTISRKTGRGTAVCLTAPDLVFVFAITSDAGWTAAFAASRRAGG